MGSNTKEYNTSYKGFRSRNAWHLGQWVCRSAMRDQRGLSHVNALTPIYMEQDLYCLASSMGNSYAKEGPGSAVVESAAG